MIQKQQKGLKDMTSTDKVSHMSYINIPHNIWKDYRKVAYNINL
jgi:hypothetical protein